MPHPRPLRAGFTIKREAYPPENLAVPETPVEPRVKALLSGALVVLAA
jgi:hypothetical protein